MATLNLVIQIRSRGNSKSRCSFRKRHDKNRRRFLGPAPQQAEQESLNAFCIITNQRTKGFTATGDGTYFFFSDSAGRLIVSIAWPARLCGAADNSPPAGLSRSFPNSIPTPTHSIRAHENDLRPAAGRFSFWRLPAPSFCNYNFPLSSTSLITPVITALITKHDCTPFLTQCLSLPW